jgi:hypothetical protein
MKKNITMKLYRAFNKYSDYKTIFQLPVGDDSCLRVILLSEFEQAASGLLSEEGHLFSPHMMQRPARGQFWYVHRRQIHLDPERCSLGTVLPLQHKYQWITCCTLIFIRQYWGTTLPVIWQVEWDQLFVEGICCHIGSCSCSRARGRRSTPR